MFKAWQAGSATIAVVLLTSVLIALDLTDGAVRRWWSSRAFTTDAVGGILVVFITVLIVNQVVSIRRQRDQSRATAAQATIVLSQAIRATRFASTLGTGSTDRGEVSDEVRTYMTMLLIAAPVLIDAKVPRAFLEQAQKLGGQLVRTLAADRYHKTAPSSADLEELLRQVKNAAAPLIAVLTAEERTAAGGEDIEQASSSTREP